MLNGNARHDNRADSCSNVEKQWVVGCGPCDGQDADARDKAFGRSPYSNDGPVGLALYGRSN
eukprot:718304-Pleurochrysis_carterae.AAC.1